MRTLFLFLLGLISQLQQYISLSSGDQMVKKKVVKN